MGTQSQICFRTCARLIYIFDKRPPRQNKHIMCAFSDTFALNSSQAPQAPNVFRRKTRYRFISHNYSSRIDVKRRELSSQHVQVGAKYDMDSHFRSASTPPLPLPTSSHAPQVHGGRRDHLYEHHWGSLTSCKYGLVQSVATPQNGSSDAFASPVYVIPPSLRIFRTISFASEPVLCCLGKVSGAWKTLTHAPQKRILEQSSIGCISCVGY
ncbi:hypothetical protein BJ741DRAFT_619573 [Chytriomyces cf. hyalinus JEL632]|nr:hypothetical protein BJ741DRAFT_619573 [Chytriomyces cf. hyalinus JEL632]